MLEATAVETAGARDDTSDPNAKMKAKKAKRAKKTDPLVGKWFHSFTRER